ncbi:MAG TPA: helix-turn-helix domain-containing protein [Planctomycetota bacterium]|nr:helix-turn-helix domain-containing protein [Planctomycetota bacterium]
MSNTSPTEINPVDILRALGVSNRATVQVREFATFCGKSRNWAYRLIKNGDLHVIETGGNLLVPVTEVLRFATGGK